MVRRFAVVAIVVAAFLVLAMPALAWNGLRDTYTTSAACATCHQNTGDPATAGAPKVYNDWAATAHGQDPEAASAGASIPNGSVCGGCHTANYDPSKVVPTPIATGYLPASSSATPSPVPTATTISWGAVIPSPFPVQTAGSAPYSELDIGCSSCHYGVSVASNGSLAQDGNDPGSTAHTAAPYSMANADICGTCHSRYAYTVNTFTVTPLPYVKVDASGSPIANPSPIGTIQPQMALDYPVLHGLPLSNYLNIPTPGWTPAPTATTVAGVQAYWSVNGVGTVWQSKGHEGSSAQYPEWQAEGHANALVDLKADLGPSPNFPVGSCLQCHSADYRNAPTNAKPTYQEAQYGITCTGCHTPHNKGVTKGVWDEEFDSQLVVDTGNPSDLCGTCHNSQIGDSTQAAGATVYENQKEIMDGTGAIGVPSKLLVSNHRGKCVECHMPPTSYGQNKPQLGGNHTFKIIYPVVAAAATAPGTPTSPAQPHMPYSSCSTCHAKGTTPNNATPDPLATNIQPLADAHQANIRGWYDKVTTDLVAAGQRMGFAHTASATDYISWLNNTLNTKGTANWSPDDLKWQQAYTDWTYTSAEGSWGIHNYSYSLLTIQTADTLALQVNKTPQTLTLKLSKTSVKKNTKVTFSGKVSPATAGTVQIQKKNSKGVFVNWKSAKLSGGKYSIKVKMTSKGTFYFKSFLAPNPSYAGDTTGKVKLVVKK